MKNVLFICTGNSCRSPMAEGLFRDLVRGRDDIRVGSAGIGAVSGQPPTSHSVEVMDEAGIDIAAHRSRPVSAEMIRRADFIFCMTYGHLDSMLLLFPEAAEKTYLVREFEDDLSPMARDIADPIGGPRELYRRTRDQIARSLPRLLDYVLSTDLPAASGTLFLACDPEGISLRDTARGWLKGRSLRADEVSLSAEADEYPRLAARIAAEEGASALVLCGAETARAIAVSRLPGVRAAAVRDAAAARAARAAGANVLCLAARETAPQTAVEILEAWFSASANPKESPAMSSATGSSHVPPSLAQSDPAIADLLRLEGERQAENIELIASENFTSRAVMEAQGSCLTNKYAEGYPGRRWYGGCEHVDVVEQLAMDRAKELFGAEYVNVQPHSGSQANMAVYFAFIKPGDTILTMDLSHGGHLTHGNKMNFSGRFYNVVHYGVSQGTETIDYDALQKMAEEHKPKLITAGASAYPRIIDFQRMGEIARSVGALLFIDMAHIAGLVAAGVHPSPIPHADFVTTTTHKTLRGPRGGLIMAKAQYAKELDSQVFPGIQGGPLMHVIAAKAVCLGEALRPEFKEYQKQVVQNAKALCEGMKKNGYRIISGTTENHLMLVDLRPNDLTGKDAQETLDRAGITVNKNAIPFDTVSPFKGGGIRLGTPAVTTRGMKTDEMFDIANLIHEALKNRTDAAKLAEIQGKVREITARFPLPY